MKCLFRESLAKETIRLFNYEVDTSTDHFLSLDISLILTLSDGMINE